MTDSNEEDQTLENTLTRVMGDDGDGFGAPVMVTKLVCVSLVLHERGDGPILHVTAGDDTLMALHTAVGLMESALVSVRAQIARQLNGEG